MAAAVARGREMVSLNGYEGEFEVFGNGQLRPFGTGSGSVQSLASRTIPVWAGAGVLAAAVLARGPYLAEEHLDLGAAHLGREEVHPEDDSLEAVEAAHVQRILTETGGVKRRAAEILKISRTRLDRIIQKYELEVSE